MVVTVWHLWEARHGVRNDERMKHPHSLAEKIRAYIGMILLHLFKPTSSSRRETMDPPVWSPQPAGTDVVNVDAALFSSSNRMGVGVVIRDHNGDFLTACSQILNEVTTPELAEALAVRCAISLARDEGLDRILLFSDCLSVIQRINLGVVTEDIKLLATSLSHVTFRHVSCLCNNSAHTLARRAELFGSSYFQICAPDCIRDKLCIDVF